MTYTHTNEPTKAPFTFVTPTKCSHLALIPANVSLRFKSVPQCTDSDAVQAKGTTAYRLQGL